MDYKHTLFMMLCQCGKGWQVRVPYMDVISACFDIMKIVIDQLMTFTFTDSQKKHYSGLVKDWRDRRNQGHINGTKRPKHTTTTLKKKKERKKDGFSFPQWRE